MIVTFVKFVHVAKCHTRISKCKLSAYRLMQFSCNFDNRFYMRVVCSSVDLKTSIERLLRGISHESVDVRLLALTKLKTLLHNNQVGLLSTP